MLKNLKILTGLLLFMAVGIGLSVFTSNAALAASSSSAAQEGAALGDEILYVHLNPIIVPILSDTGSTQIITLVVAIEVPNDESVAMVERNRIRLTDAFLTDMYGVLDKNRLIKNGYIDIERVKSRLNKISKRVVGEESISGVMLEAVQQRKV